MSGCLLPYLVPPSQDSPEEMSESIGLASLPHLKVQTLALNQPNATNVNPAASAVGSILSGVATLEHPSHSQSSGVEWNNFTYTSTSPGNNILLSTMFLSSLTSPTQMHRIEPVLISRPTPNP
jgi:hypothetical protein